MHTNSIIELNRSAYQNNINFLKKTFGKKVVLSSVVKGNAYGHGVREFVSMAYDCGVTHFSVFDVEEAKVVKETLFDQVTIMVMGLVQEQDMEWVVANNVEFFVFDKIRLNQAIRAAKKLKKQAIIHIEAETGMNRTGFEKKELTSIIPYLKKEKEHLYFKGLCTHYAGAESIANYYRVDKQIKKFEEIYQYLCNNDLRPEIKHSACSAASIMFPETRMDMVRIGIMQYGLWSSPEVFVNFLNTKKNKTDPLKRVITWKSSVMSVKKVSIGDFIGYGTSFLAERNMKIAVIPIGYSHGYSRSLSNQGRVLINGQRCIVVGSVNMNMMTVDVTDIETVKKDDEVVLIGTQEELTVSVSSFSDFSNQLNYELLTRIAKTIPRKIII
ncbi:alanine racemase [Flavobacterium sp. 7E]|uniref:alanine racemase n=1 Tax=unclassified Flavobacterium TaxID=196869 RepID=UPI00156F64E2|nr:MULTISPECIES: alanine racemase [unclassified Flavobacterium]MBE0391853.1 Alanine racemase 1 [Flavobacterium sp. PL002]NRS89825.1 alanine racemase [Flavobacterium sp. 7E]NRT16632.1 alanine racemase [Flavobacterium sp. 28A]